MNIFEITESAKARFAEIPFPHRKDEYWRFADLLAWNADALFPFFTNAAPQSRAEGKLLEIEKELDAQNTISLFDGQAISANLPEGVKLCRVDDFAERSPELVEKFYNSAIGKFDTLVSARANGGLVLEVGKELSVELNLKVISKLGLSVSSILFVVGGGSKLRLIRHFATNENSFSLSRMKFLLAENSTLELATFKYSAENSRAYLRDDFEVLSGATVVDACAELGLSPSRSERNFEILGEGADVDSRSFVRSSGKVLHDLRTSQHHKVGGSNSNLDVKSVVSEDARLAFMGLVRVEEDAQKTKAYQSCNSLALSDTAKTQASPILEIMANDVECSHGCTVSKPDTEEVFYMNQRGLSESDALNLITSGFASATFEKLGIEFEI